MNQDQKLQKALDYAKSLAEEIGIFRIFDDQFAPLDDDLKKDMFKSKREAGWPVLKKAIFIMDKEGRVMMFFRPPMETSRIEKGEFTAPASTYGLTACNSIIVHGDGFMSTSELIRKKVNGWLDANLTVSAGMGHAVVASGYLYFFEVSYSIVAVDTMLSIGGMNAHFVDLEHAIDIMNSHGLEYKDLEITIAKTLSEKGR